MQPDRTGKYPPGCLDNMLNNEENYNETENVQQTEGQTGLVNNQAQNGGEVVNEIVGEAVNQEASEDTSFHLEQEMCEKLKELASQHLMREEQLVELTLNRIVEGVESHESEITELMVATKGHCDKSLRRIVSDAIKCSANGQLLCRDYSQRSKSDQQVIVYTGSHWEPTVPQLWKDFVDRSAEQCGVSESQRKDHTFMNQLYENVAFNIKGYHVRVNPPDEVWLNARNGTLELKSDGSVVLREHRKEDMFTYTLNYPFDSQAECPQWHRFIDRVLPEMEAQQVLAEFVGYCLMPDHRLEKMLWLQGEGQNGKSVTLEIIEALLGSGNVSYLSLSDLTNDAIKRAGIEGKLLNISHESGKDVNPNVLKQLASGERVTIERKYKDPREINDYGKFGAAFNQLPRAEVTGGYFRRIIILPYNVTITEEEKDVQLAQKLKTELPGILNWVLQALPGLMKRCTFTDSDICKKAMSSYLMQSDNVRLFYSEMCEPQEYTTIGDTLFTAYKDFCKDSLLYPLGKNRFYKRLDALTHSRVDYGNVAYFKLKVKEQ